MTLADSLVAEPPPISVDEDGVARVGGTRVTLDTVVAAFTEGASAEEIAQRYPTLKLQDIYGTLGYCLRHWDQVQEYLNQREQEAGSVRRENEARFPPQGVRERLLARSSKPR